MKTVFPMSLALVSLALVSCSSSGSSSGAAKVAAWETKHASKGYTKIPVRGHMHFHKPYDGRQPDGTLAFFKAPFLGFAREDQWKLHFYDGAKNFKIQGCAGADFHSGHYENIYIKGELERGAKIIKSSTSVFDEFLFHNIEGHCILADDQSDLKVKDSDFVKVDRAYRTMAIKHGATPDVNPQPITNWKGAKVNFDSDCTFNDVRIIADLAHSKDRSNR